MDLSFFKFGWLYIKAVTSDAHMSLLQMISMTLRKVDVRSIVEYRIMAKKAGIDIVPSSLEAHSLAGGNITMLFVLLLLHRRQALGLVLTLPVHWILQEEMYLMP